MPLYPVQLWTRLWQDACVASRPTRYAYLRRAVKIDIKK